MTLHVKSQENILGTKRGRLGRFLVLALLLILTLAFWALVSGHVAQAAVGDVTIVVLDRESGAPIPEFRYLINVDIAHQAEDGTPPWSTNPKSYSPIVAHGTEMTPTVNLPDGKYLVSVMGGPFPPTPGSYKMSGTHFTVNGNEQIVTVELVPGPLELAAMTVQVHHDNLMVNGAWDPPVEQGLEGFAVLLEDGTGEVTVDFFGNPICTEYDEFGEPVPDTGGQCLTDADGLVTIPNLPPLKYGAFAIPPDGSGWIQTSTIEGTNVIDAWLEEGSSGYTIEEGFAAPMVSLGFVQPCEFGLCPTGVHSNAKNISVPDIPDPPNPPQGSGSITGRIREAVEAGAEGQVVAGKAVPRPYVALNNLSGNDEQVYTGRGNPDGTFTIPNVADGLYQLVIWDFPQLYIISFETVQVTGGQAVNVGDIIIPRWFGQIQGYAYWDTGYDASGNLINDLGPDGIPGPVPGKPGAENGFRDCQPGAAIDDAANCELGIGGQDLDVRFNDGSIKYAAFADNNGYYDFPTHFPFGHYLIWEIGFGRYKQMSTAGYFTEFSGDGLTPVPTGYPYNPQNRPGCGDLPNGSCDTDSGNAEFGPASLLQAQITLAGFYNWIDSGKVPYPADENGGISGLVIYAATRNEYDPRHAAAEDYEPGVPNVTINLYQAALDANQQPISCTVAGPGCPYGEGELKRVSSAPGPDPDFGDLVDSVETDSYDAAHPTDCYYPDLLGGTVYDSDCLEIPKNLRQINDGVFDGGYAFEGVAAGAYIVEMVAPDHYRHIKEEDQNTDQGDDYIIPAVPPPACAGPLHTVSDPRNPEYNNPTPLCESKFVRVVNGTNPPAEFYIMTDFDDSVDAMGNPVDVFSGTAEVPPPGFMRGILFDDLNIEFDPASPMFQGKKGVGNTPVGILDFQGNEIAVVNTDDEGFFEVLLPSSYTRLCPTPGGVCPAMYRVVGNYPGQDPLNPLANWNPAYATLTIILDIWSGKTTYADVAITPTSGFGFDNPPVCTAIGPDVQSVDKVHDVAGTTFSIYGSGFGGGTGSVSLGNSNLTVNSWTDTAINVTIPNNASSGPQQLLVTDAAGVAGETGITFHVTGGNYNPAIVDVYPSADPVANPSPLQDAIDAASAGSLIVVHPGEYFESPIVYKSLKLQGYGPGVTSIDGRLLGFGDGGPFDTAAWEQKIANINPVGPLGGGGVPIGQVVTFVATNNTTHSTQFRTQIDGFEIIGGSRNRAGDTAVLPVQGGGIYAHAQVNHLLVSNNRVQSNAGNFGGGIILGQAYMGNNANADVSIHHNRVLNNGGFSLAGGIAIFNGANGYQIDHNVVCGNESAEYGGGISHFGESDGGSITDNRIVFNSAFDEGGGIMIAGELQENGAVPPGSGAVTIARNLIQHNLSNDDGGGIRLLSPVDGYVRIENNMIANNLATDLGGGISLDDALHVEIVNNTIVSNTTTATAEDSDGNPHGAGITSEGHSAALLATLGNNDPDFSDPVMFNNILWHNEAWYLDGGDPLNPLVFFDFIDLEVFGTTTTEYLTPRYSLLTYQPMQGTNNLWEMDPLFLDGISLAFHALPLTGEPAFIGVSITATPADNQGDYHLSSTASPAWDAAADHFGSGQSRVDAPVDDFDSDPRPAPGNGQPTTDRDIGADEIYP